MSRLTQKDVRDLQPGEIKWSGDPIGLGIRCQKFENALKPKAKSWVLFYRTADGRSRLMTIGKAGPIWTADKARDAAIILLGRVINGEDPLADRKRKTTGPYVRNLLDDYERDVLPTKKASTQDTDRSRIRVWLRPRLGGLKVAAVCQDDVEKLKAAGAAPRVLRLGRALFEFAIDKRLRPDNPFARVDLGSDDTRDCRLEPDEYQRLGEVLRTVEGYAPAVVAAAEFLAFTGWRLGEAIGLRWDEVNLDARTANLPDTKSGRSRRALGTAAVAVLKRQERHSELVFPPTSGARLQSLGPATAELMALAKVKHAFAHALRHAFVAMGRDLNLTDERIGPVVGHARKRNGSATSGYGGSAPADELRVAEKISKHIAGLMR